METLKQYKRLLHTLVPFAGFMFCDKVTGLLFDFFCRDFSLREALSFVVSAAAAFLLYRIKAFETDDNPHEVSPIVKDSVGMGILCAVFAVGAGIALRYFAETMTDYNPAPPDVTVFQVISIVLIHPVIYEILFRRMFYSDLRMMSVIFGCLATAVMSAIAHTEVVSMAFWLCAGVVLGCVTELSGRLFPSLAAHIIYNLRLYIVTCGILSEKVCDVADAVLISAGALAFILILVLRSRTFSQSVPPETDTKEETVR